MPGTSAYANTGAIKEWSRQSGVNDAEKQWVLGRPERRESPDQARVNQKVGHSRLLTNSLAIPKAGSTARTPGPWSRPGWGRLGCCIMSEYLAHH